MLTTLRRKCIIRTAPASSITACPRARAFAPAAAQVQLQMSTVKASSISGADGNFRQPEQRQQTVGFIGAGMMATAMIDGLIAAGLAPAASILCADVDSDARARAAGRGVVALESNAEVASQADLLVLAVKPASMLGVCAELAEAAVPSAKTLFVSVAAGVTLGQLEAALPGQRVVRVMPNTPCVVASAASAFAVGTLATPEDAASVHQLLSAVGAAAP